MDSTLTSHSLFFAARLYKAARQVSKTGFGGVLSARSLSSKVCFCVCCTHYIYVCAECVVCAGCAGCAGCAAVCLCCMHVSICICTDHAARTRVEAFLQPSSSVKDDPVLGFKSSPLAQPGITTDQAANPRETQS